MSRQLHGKHGTQLVIGLLLGIGFVFLLQKGGATRYDVILGQLLWQDFTVVKIMLSAVLTGMIGVHVMRSMGIVELHPKPGSAGATLLGGLLFGVGFAVLGYCPGTSVAAVGQGSLDALVGGVIGITLGAGVFAALFPSLQQTLSRGDFGDLTLPQLLKVNQWVVVVPVAGMLAALLWVVETYGP
jgi:hypothetical protein